MRSRDVRWSTCRRARSIPQNRIWVREARFLHSCGKNRPVQPEFQSNSSKPQWYWFGRSHCSRGLILVIRLPSNSVPTISAKPLDPFIHFYQHIRGRVGSHCRLCKSSFNLLVWMFLFYRLTLVESIPCGTIDLVWSYGTYVSPCPPSLREFDILLPVANPPSAFTKNNNKISRFHAFTLLVFHQNKLQKSLGIHQIVPGKTRDISVMYSNQFGLDLSGSLFNYMLSRHGSCCWLIPES